MYVPITQKILHELKAQGFKILISPNDWDKVESPTYQAVKIEGAIEDYLRQLQRAGKLSNVDHYMVIEKVFSLPDGTIEGSVWIDDVD